MFSRARKNTLCSSRGSSDGKSGFGDSVGCGVSGSVSWTVLSFLSVVIPGMLIFGRGIVINGLFLRTISVVVAMYKGRADKIKSPNTKPANPCRRALNRRCH